MVRTKKCARKGQGGLYAKQVAVRKAALARKTAANHTTGRSSTTQTLILIIDLRLSSSKLSAADEMDLCCPEGDRDERTKGSTA